MPQGRVYVLPAGKSLVLIPGNIDIMHRPTVHNRDGSTSSVFSSSFGIERGMVILVPGVIRDSHGRWIRERSRSRVWAAYKRTGQHLGIFRTQAAADRYAKLLHQQQAGLVRAGG